jgi:hypothetical protein
MTTLVDRPNCPACASADAAPMCRVLFGETPLWPSLKQRYRDHVERVVADWFEVAECRDCSAIFQTKVGSPDLLNDLYDRWLPSTLDAETTAHFDWLAAHPRQSRDGHDLMTAAMLLQKPLDGLRVLDFGMGQGLWTCIAKALGCDTSGSDLSASRMAMADTHGITAVESADIPGGDYDFINAEQVFEHLTDIDGTMRTLVAGMRRGGLLRISVPSQGNVRSALADIVAGRPTTLAAIDPVSPLEHVNAFSREGLEKLGRRFGVMPVTPSFWQRAAFLRYKGSVSLSAGKNTIKELARPFVPMENGRSLTMWFRLPDHVVVQ